MYNFNGGVPQGSVLVPMLFLIYLNSIFYLKLSAKLIAFADDLLFLYNDRLESTNIQSMNSDLCSLRKWCLAHTMFLSIKTKGMFFKLNNEIVVQPEVIYHDIKCDNITCCAGCFNIEFVSKFKYLGLTMDASMRWLPHIDSLRIYLYSVIRKFYILRSACPLAVLRIIYFALVESRLSYGLICWGGTYNNRIYPLVIAQKHVIRIMLNSTRLSASWPLFEFLEIFPIRHLFVYKVMKSFFSIKDTQSHVSVNYNLRNKQYIRLEKFTTTNYQNSFQILAPKIFNSLPDDLKGTHKINIFKLGLKSFLFKSSSVNDLLHFQV